MGSVVNIEEGSSLSGVSRFLKEEKIIRSRAAFEFFVIMLGGEKRLQPAYYSFTERLPVYTVAWRIAGGEFFMAPATVTIPEGFNREQMAEAFALKLENFDAEEFLLLTADKEGYLFPDTYFFFLNSDEEDAIAAMEENFKKKITPLMPQIETSGKTLKDIITMASVIEGEAKGDDDRSVIAGILWKRIDKGMPLQVDAAPVTYEEKGLPKTPIGNPGLKSMLAALRPEDSPYLYYLHDQEGNIHYAESFAEHKQNKLKYLK